MTEERNKPKKKYVAPAEQPLVTRGDPLRPLDGPFPPIDREDNVWYRAVKASGMLDSDFCAVNMVPISDVYRSFIYPPQSEQPDAPHRMKVVNAYRILKHHDSHPGCSSCFDNFNLRGAISDRNSKDIFNFPETSFIHFFHTFYGYEGLIDCNSPESRLFLVGNYKYGELFKELLKEHAKTNLFLKGPIDFLIPRTSIGDLTPAVVVPGLVEIAFQNEFGQGDLFLLNNAGVTQIPFRECGQIRVGEYFSEAENL